MIKKIEEEDRREKTKIIIDIMLDKIDQIIEWCNNTQQELDSLETYRMEQLERG